MSASSTAPEKVTRAAEMLIAVRRTGERIADLPEAVAPSSEDEAWAVQREVVRLMGDRIGGWKCAAPPGRPQSGACMMQAGFQRSPGRVSLAAGDEMGIEGEIAVRLGTDLPGRPDGQPYTREDVVGAIAAVMPAIELVQSRYSDLRAVSNLATIADSVSNIGFVHGADATDWRSLDLSRLKVRLSFGDKVELEQVGGNPSGDPLLPVAWLANRLIATGTHLRAGEIITTGSCTGLIFTGPGKRISVTFEGLGAVELDLQAG